jgi:hypothetical protein
VSVEAASAPEKKKVPPRKSQPWGKMMAASRILLPSRETAMFIRDLNAVGILEEKALERVPDVLAQQEALGQTVPVDSLLDHAKALVIGDIILEDARSRGRL